MQNTLKCSNCSLSRSSPSPPSLLPLGPVSGVVGGSVLHRCVLEIDAPRRVPGARAPPKMTARVHLPPPAPQLPECSDGGDGPSSPSDQDSPSSARLPGGVPARVSPCISPRASSRASCWYIPQDERLALCWQEVRFLDGQPHILAKVWVGAAASDEQGDDGEGGISPGSGSGSGAGHHEGWFRLALGVGGTGLVLSGTAAAELGFFERTTPLAPTGMMAGPGEGRARMAALAVKGGGVEGEGGEGGTVEGPERTQCQNFSLQAMDATPPLVPSGGRRPERPRRRTRAARGRVPPSALHRAPAAPPFLLSGNVRKQQRGADVRRWLRSLLFRSPARPAGPAAQLPRLGSDRRRRVPRGEAGVGSGQQQVCGLPAPGPGSNSRQPWRVVAPASNSPW